MAAENFDITICLEKVRRNDSMAARALVEHLQPFILKIVRANLSYRLDEEDLAQEVFLKIFSRLDQYRGQVAFEHWISRIAVNTCIDQLRFQKSRPELRWTDLSPAEAAALEASIANKFSEEPSQAVASRELVQKLLECLSVQDRLCIQFLDLQGLSIDEIAQQTGWNRSFIKVRAFRARRKLKGYLKRLLQTKGQI